MTIISEIIDEGGIKMKRIEDDYRLAKKELPGEFAIIVGFHSYNEKPLVNIFNFAYLQGMKNAVRIQEEVKAKYKERHKDEEITEYL